MATTIQKQQFGHQGNHVSLSLLGAFDKIGELIWFLLSFVLFVALGPFSAPIALIALLQVGVEDNDQVAPESL